MQQLVNYNILQIQLTVWYELNYPQIQPDIVLPNGVHDEYNPETGVYTKKSWIYCRFVVVQMKVGELSNRP